MQLFHCTDLHFQGDTCKIRNHPELVRQLRKVLRAQAGYEFFVQVPPYQFRYQLRLESRTDSEVLATLVQKIPAPLLSSATAMAIALPNKQEKLELIVQKLTEIGISHIFLRASERSVLKELSAQKSERLQKIMIEAMEQSRGRKLPEIQQIKSLSELQGKRNFQVFDLPKETVCDKEKKEKSDLPLLGIIGPEGGLTEKDYLQFPSDFSTLGLGENVLRMETAAIIGAWLLKNGHSK